MRVDCFLHIRTLNGAASGCALPSYYNAKALDHQAQQHMHLQPLL
jgi:hypothetical protein